MQSPKSFMFVVLLALAPALLAQDAKPLRVLRYRNPVTHAHGITIDPAAHPAGWVGEDVPDTLASSPVFYMPTEPYASTVPIYQFRARNGMMVFAANMAERQAWRANGLEESGPPLYLYDHQVEGSAEVFRLLRPSDGDTVYTTSAQEKKYYSGQGWISLSSLGFAQPASSSGTGILRETTIKLDSSDVVLLARTVKRGQQLIFGTTNTKIDALLPGTILYAEKSNGLPLGLVARISAISRTSAGETQIDTEPADLADAFVEFHLYLEGKQVYFVPPDADGTAAPSHKPVQPELAADERAVATSSGRLTPEYMASMASIKITGSTTILPDGASWSQSLVFGQDLYKKTSGNTTDLLHLDGNLTFDATAELVYNGYNACVVKPTIVFLLSPHEHGSLTVTASGDLTTQKEQKFLGPYTATFAVGGIPVSVELNVYGGFTAAANVTASVTAAVDAHLTAGIQYDLTSQQLSPIICPSPCPNGFTCGPTRVTGPTCSFTPSLTGSLTTTAQLSVYARPELYLYAGAWGTGIGPTAYTKLQLTAALESPNINVYGELIPGVGARLQAAHCTIQQWGPKEFDPWVDLKLASFPLVLPPTVSALKINSGSTTTTNRTVTLNNAATNNPTQYEASESPTFAGASWQPYASAPLFTLSSAGGGSKVLYFRVKNNSGESAPVTATITLVVAPTISSFSINNSATSTTSRTLSLSSTVTNAPTQCMVSESSSFTGATWQTYTSSLSFTLSATPGTKVVYFKVQNAAGVSTIANSSITLIVAPSITSFRINNGAASTTSRTVTLNNTATNTPTQYLAGETASFSGAAWQSYATTPSFTLSAAKGTKRVYFRVQNGAGVSPVQTAQITLK